MIGKTFGILRKKIYITLLMVFLSLPVVFVNAEGGVYEFNYTGEYQTFVVPSSGTYKLETWGSQSTSNGELGGYASGTVYLNRGDILYVYVGTDGGTTDIRFVPGEWNTGDGLKSRLIFAGGGNSTGSVEWYGDVCDSSNNYQTFCNGNGGSSFTWNEHTKVYVPTGYSVSEDYFMTSVSYESGVREGDGFAKISIVALDGIANIKINNGNIPIGFSYDVYEYIVTISDDVENVKYDVVAEDGYDVTLSNPFAVMPDYDGILPVLFASQHLYSWNTITLTDRETGIVQIYTIKIRKQRDYLNVWRSITDPLSEYLFTGPYVYYYTGTYEKFYAPETGTYILEAWGAEGGNDGTNVGGKGGYSKAEMYLEKGEVLYIYVGGSGSTLPMYAEAKGWNGGGHTASVYNEGGARTEHAYLYGGGATDIRYGGNSLYNRVLVAGGGGSAGPGNNAGGAAGVAAIGKNGTGGEAGTLSNPGTYASFGYGGDGLIIDDGTGFGVGGAGGGGWYGGGGVNPGYNIEDVKGGGGGSGFAFTSEYSQYVPEGYLVPEEHYLTSAVLMNGDETFLGLDGETPETGHSGNGCVKITLKRDEPIGVYKFEYTGDYQTFVVPKSGTYKLETFGAQGSNPSNYSGDGRGGYTSGLVYLNRGDILYVYVGGDGDEHQGWNGGGAQETLNLYGGGATDIRFVPGEWNSEAGLKSRLIVAGGGGSGDASGTNIGGSGGLIGTSGSGSGSSSGANISACRGYRCGFGYGGSGTSLNEAHAGAGGGGWYGGGGANSDGFDETAGSGAGGSSFTWNKHTKIYVPEGYSVSEDYFMTSVVYESLANEGDGYAIITAIELDGITDIEVNNGEIPIDFSYDIYEYNITVENSVNNVEFNISVEEGYDLIQSNRSTDMTNLLSVSNIITLTDNKTGIVQTYTVNIRKQNSYLEDKDTESYGYSYTGNYEKFYVPTTGVYILEAWGAQGGHRGLYNGGKGGYSKAQMYLQEGEVIYIYVGGSGNTLSQDGTSKGWNGGGHTVSEYSVGGSREEITTLYGGGATDIRYGGQSLYNRVLVAGGGGSVGSGEIAGGAAGVDARNFYGTTSGNSGKAGTLSAPGTYNASFGYGGDGFITSGNNYGGSGGGGWYGGGGVNTPDNKYDTNTNSAQGGGGGSGFAFTSANSKYAPTGYLVTEENYLAAAVLMDGDETFASPDGTDETGHTGDGYVRITLTDLDANNYLSDLSASTGFDQIFDKEILEYTKVTYDKEITISAILETEFASYSITDVNGNVIDSFPTKLQLGENIFLVSVTAKNGDVRTYKITIVRELAAAAITNIVPSVGELNPLFKQDVTTYTMEVEGEVESISFDVITKSSEAVVTGNELIELLPGKNIVTITSIAKDGSSQDLISIEIYRKLDIVSFDVEEEIYLMGGDDYKLKIIYNPGNTDYKQMSYTVADSFILTVSEDGIIMPLRTGDTTITVTSVRNPSLTKTIAAHVIGTRFETDVYDINRVTEDGEIDYVIGVEPKTTIKDFLANFKNNPEFLHVYTFEGDDVGEEITDLNQNVGTSMAIMLIIEDEMLDGALVVVRGDLNGDGYVTVADQTAVKNMILGKLEKNFLNIKAADVTMEGMITVADMTKVKNHILGKVPSLNE